MLRITVCLLMAILLAAPALAAPRMWSDDFTSMATYNSISWLAPCYGPAPSTKYTVFEMETGDVANEKVVAGAGLFIFTNRSRESLVGRLEAAAIGALNFGQGCPDVAGIPFYESTESFTSDDVCLYTGVIYSAYQTVSSDAGATYSIKGPDGQPGVAGRDDDADGQTDDDDESPAARETSVGGGYGNRNGTGFWAGPDGAPGVVSVDDDANGTTDDIDETRTPGSDDTDDYTRQPIWLLINSDMQTSSAMLLEMELLLPRAQFNFWEIAHYVPALVEDGDELPAHFYQPGVHYNIAFCASGSCYGAMLWTEKDMSNPNETLGPVINTKHLDPTSNLVGPAFFQESQPLQYIRRARLVGNSSFDDTFWVISGNARDYFPPIAADFDNDHDVDGQDFMKFSKCFNGSLRPPKATCENPEANFDGDIDVDGQDFMAFSKCFNGSLRRPKCLPPILTNCP